MSTAIAPTHDSEAEVFRVRLRRACEALAALETPYFAAIAREIPTAAPGERWPMIVNCRSALLAERTRAAASGDRDRHIAATVARDALGALWAVCS